jgi:hypothetical protein
MRDGHVAPALLISLYPHHRQRHPGEGVDRQGHGHLLGREGRFSPGVVWWGRGHEGRQAPQQLQGIEEQRRGAVAPGPAKLIQELATTVRQPCGERAGSATVGSRPSSRPTSSASASRRPRRSLPRPAARCPPTTSRPLLLLSRPRPGRRPRAGGPLHPERRRRRRHPRALRGVRPARAGTGAAGGVRRRRRLQVHPAADVPARPDARSAGPARRRRRAHLPPAGRVIA